MAIEYNNSDAMYNLGYYYNYVEKNYKEAIKYYKMAIEHNHPKAKKNLKKLYQQLLESHQIKESNIIEICAICKDEKEVLNLKCNNKYDHYYYSECFKNWYSKNNHVCLLCYCEFDLEDFFIL